MPLLWVLTHRIPALGGGDSGGTNDPRSTELASNQDGLLREEVRRIRQQARDDFKTALQSAFALAIGVSWSNVVGYELSDQLAE